MSQWITLCAVRMPGAVVTPRGLKRGEAHEQILGETRALLDSLRGHGLDLVVTPEAVESLGMNAATAESLDAPGPFLRLYQEFARAEHCCVAGSCKLREGGQVFNSLAIIAPGGRIAGRYHKAFLTDGERAEGLASGAGAVVVETPAGRIGGLICFDLNFARLRREYAALRPQVLVFSSEYHGGLAQTAWAYECRAFFVSSHMGMEGVVRDPFGRILAETSEYTRFGPARARVNLDYILIHLDRNGERFPDIRRKYGDAVTLDIPAHVGSVMLSSNTSERTASQIAAEFRLELLDDYFARNAAENDANRVPPAPAQGATTR